MKSRIEPIHTHSFLDRDLSVFNTNLNLPRHGWFEFKEGFSRDFVGEAIRTVSRDLGKRRLNILDPFSGSGTSLLSAAELGHAAVGIEVNPFLAFVGRAKCTVGGWRKSDYDRTVRSILSRAKDEVPSDLEGLSTFTEGGSNKQWLFNRSVLRGFTALDSAIYRSGPYWRPLRLGLLASLMDCCNAKRDGKCLRYLSDWSSLGFSSNELRNRFEIRAGQIWKDATAQPLGLSHSRIIRQDSRVGLKSLPSAKFDLVVTSPPYLNSFDYSDVYRPEMFAGGFVRSNEQLRGIRKQTVRSHVQVGWRVTEEIATPALSPIMDRLEKGDLWSKRLPEMVRAYFSDMDLILTETFRVTKKKGQLWLVVATSAYSGVEIPTDLLIADIAGRRGWQLQGVYVLRQLRSSGQQRGKSGLRRKLPLRESLVILTKR